MHDHMTHVHTLTQLIFVEHNNQSLTSYMLTAELMKCVCVCVCAWCVGVVCGRGVCMCVCVCVCKLFQTIFNFPQQVIAYNQRMLHSIQFGELYNDEAMN